MRGRRGAGAHRRGCAPTGAGSFSGPGLNGTGPSMPLVRMAAEGGEIAGIGGLTGSSTAVPVIGTSRNMLRADQWAPMECAPRSPADTAHGIKDSGEDQWAPMGCAPRSPADTAHGIKDSGEGRLAPMECAPRSPADTAHGIKDSGEGQWAPMECAPRSRGAHSGQGSKQDCRPHPEGSPFLRNGALDTVVGQFELLPRPTWRAWSQTDPLPSTRGRGVPVGVLAASTAAACRRCPARTSSCRAGRRRRAPRPRRSPARPPGCGSGR